MMVHRRGILVCLAGLLLPVIGVGQDCPDIDSMRTRYHRARYLSLEFSQIIHSDIFETVDTVYGSLWTGGGGRFRLVTPHQELVSDGQVFWSYSVDNRQVLVDSAANRGDWNPLTLLYDPERVYRCRNQRTTNDNEIEFDMRAVDSLTAPQAFLLRVTGDDHTPVSLVYVDDNDSRIEVAIKDFKLLDSLPDSLFIFRPGPGVEVIDMP